MDVRYVTKEGALVLTLLPQEIEGVVEDIRSLMDDDEVKKVMRIPPFDEEFYEQILSINGSVAVKFKVQFFEFGVLLLETIHDNMVNGGVDARAIAEFLDDIEGYCVRGLTSH